MASGGSVNTDFMSDETFDLLCRVCKRNSKNLQAEKYCLECQDYFCVNCVKIHEDIPALTGHKILDKSQFSSRTSKKLPPGSHQGQHAAPTEKCDRHSHYIIDTYCQNHDEVGCATCMAVDHRVCKDIYYIPEFIPNNASASADGKIKKELDSTAKSLKEYHEKLQKENSQHLKQKTGILERIRKFRREINERLDKLEKDSIADIEDKYKVLIGKIEDGLRMLDANKANVKSAQDKVGAPGNNVSQDFVNAKKGKNIASNAYQCIEHNKAHINTEEVDFTPDQRITELLGEISLLGKITQRNIGATGSTATSNVQAKGNQTNSGSGTAQQTATSNVQLQAKGNPTNSGSGTAQQTATSNVQLQAKGNQTMSGSGTAQQTATSNIQLQAKGNPTNSGSGTAQQTATSNVQLQAKGNQANSGSGTAQQTATSNVQLQAKGNPTNSGSGTAQQTATSNVQLQAKGNQANSDSGTAQQTATSNVQLQAKGNQTNSGSGTAQQTATSNVQLQAKGNQPDSGSGTAQQTATSNVQLQAKGNQTNSDSGTAQQTVTSNVQLQAKGKQTNSGSGTAQQTATSNVQLQAKGNQPDSGSGTVQQTDALLQAKGSRKYNVRVQSDKYSCNIVSACTLEDGTIILSDCRNNKLKRLDSSTFTVTDFCDVPGSPWQVCPISKQEIAVCLYSKQAVQFISVGARLTKTKQINTDFVCYGLAYCNGRLYISDPTSVYTCSISGRKLRQLCKNQPGQQLFSSIISLAVSKNGSKMYVSDRNSGLIVLDNIRLVVRQYNGPQIDGAYDSYLTATGSLLVCGRNSDNVLQFGQNGDMRNEVVEFSDKEACHHAICCNPQMSKMLIGRYDNEVEVYDLGIQRI